MLSVILFSAYGVNDPCNFSVREGSRLHTHSALGKPLFFLYSFNESDLWKYILLGLLGSYRFSKKWGKYEMFEAQVCGKLENFSLKI